MCVKGERLAQRVQVFALVMGSGRPLTRYQRLGGLPVLPEAVWTKEETEKVLIVVKADAVHKSHRQRPCQATSRSPAPVSRPSVSALG